MDIVSDLHLSPALPRTTRAFLEHLAATPADGVLILGDLFELWVGDDMAQQEPERALVEALASASRNRTLAFMVGNRDFLAGTSLAAASGMRLLPDPTLFAFGPHRVLLSHGDALCLSDVPYQRFRAQVRSASWQADFLSRPLAERLQIAAGIRRTSAERRAFDGDAAAEVDETLAATWLAGAGADTLIHGHTHRPGSHGFGPGLQRHVLSDWDLDHGARAEVLRLSADGAIERLAPARRDG